MAIYSKDKKTFPVISGTLYCTQPLKLIHYYYYYQQENMNMPSFIKLFHCHAIFGNGK
jgi:hypothetical protein